MTESSNFSDTDENQDQGCLWNGMHIKMLDGTRVEVEDKEFDFNDNVQEAVSNNSPNLKNLNDTATLTFEKILKTVNFIQYGYSPGTGISKKSNILKNYIPKSCRY